MEPTIHDGQSVVVNESVAFSDLKVGDVVVFKSDLLNLVYHHPGPGNTSHRIVRRDSKRLWTKGDGNDYTDPVPVYARDYIGRIQSSSFNH